jgi:hypothetical protein
MEWWIVAGVVAVLAVVVARRKVARSRTDALRRRFGPEYDRLLAESGDRRAAEAQLREWARRRAALELHGLSAESRAAYAQSWRDCQAGFVDDPAKSVDRAAELLDGLARERGYPVDEPDLHAELLSVDLPRLVERYRTAQAIHRHSTDTPADIDDLRTAFRNYRALFNELLVRGAT